MAWKSSCATLESGAGSGAAQKAVQTALAQIGDPYVWAAAGPDAFDCSGLAMMAYRAAGIAIPRTSQAQWAYGRSVPASQVQPGDLVFFAGADGTPAAPGHVGIVIDPARHLMIDAYATGFPVGYDTYGLPSSRGGLSPVVGFTRPVGLNKDADGPSAGRRTGVGPASGVAGTGEASLTQRHCVECCGMSAEAQDDHVADLSSSSWLVLCFYAEA
jgi:hypothetical protein